METTKLLKEEMKIKPAGDFCLRRFNLMGYESCPDGDIPAKRAAACYYLFGESDPHIYKNDLIVGSRRAAYVEGLSSEEIDRINKESTKYRERGFWLNADHFAPDYWYMTKKGVSGLIADIEKSKEVHKDDGKAIATLENMKTALLGLVRMLTNYRDKAKSLIGTEGYSEDRLNFIIGNLDTIIKGAPKTFAEALQLVMMCHVAFTFEGRYAMALGRIDQYLYPFYKQDIESGTLTDEKCTELLENAFMIIYENRVLRDFDDVVNICIGGKKPDGTTAVNGLSYCVLHAVGNCNVPGPNLSARIAESTPDKFLDECLKVIGTGLGYPALMNDEVQIPALSRYGYDEEDVYNYAMVGCIENFISGKQPAWSDGRFDTPRFFEYLFNNGKKVLYREDGIDTGDVSEITSMDEFIERYKIQLAEGVKKYVEFFLNTVNLGDDLLETMTSPFLSCFCSECIERGKDINLGGAKYPSVHGAAVMGIGTVADSLAAIEKVVFEDGKATLEDIKEAMLCNFEGKEELKAALLDAPKYGNNDMFVDKYAIWLVDYLFEEFSKYRTRDGGHFYMLMAANTSNIDAGKLICATPDGRGAGEPISDAASPTYGRDTLGPTSTVLSVSKPDYTLVSGGTVVNQKYFPSMFNDENRPKLLSLIKVYFRLGGQEMQINATSSDVLKDAMDHPENYQDLVVRVSGFSAYYVTLTRDIQLDILARTQQMI